MASTTLKKDRGFLLLLFVGLLMPAAIFVSAVNTTSSTYGANSTMANATSQSNMTATTSGAMTQSSSSSMSTAWTTPMMTTNSTDGMTTANMSTAIYCPSFTCNYSNCYAMYNSQNATWCAAGSYCQLSKQMDMSYIANCSVSCDNKCMNDSQMNCCVACCNTTGCLNSTFASMMMTTTTTVSTTVVKTTTTTAPGTTTTAAPGTTTIAPNNGNKCHTGSCDGEKCYTNFKNDPLQTCTDSQQHCQLVQELGTKWTAGCVSDCSDKQTCAGDTQPMCHQECCNSTQTSCLLLNGDLNVFSFATRGPHLHTELTASLLCLLAIAIML